MLTPEEDFDTWSSMLLAIADCMDELSEYLPKFATMIDEIVSEGKLKAPLTEETEFFTSNTIKGVFNTILGIENMLFEEEIVVAIEFFKKILDLALYGLKTFNKTYIELSIPLLEERQGDYTFPFFKYNSTYDLTILTTYAKEIGFFKEIENLLNNDSVDFDLYYKVSVIYLHSEKDDPNTMLKSILKKLISLLKKDKRCGEGQKIWSILCYMYHFGLGDYPELIDLVIDIAVLLIKTDIFEREKYGYETLKCFLLEDKYKEETCKHFNDIQLLTKTTLHEQFMPIVGKILAILTQLGKTNFDTIKEMWSLRKVFHPSTMNEFYSIFLTLAKRVPVEILLPMTEMIKESDDIKFLKSYTLKLGKREDAVSAFSSMRVFFINLAFSEKASPDIMETLGEILSFHLSDEDFNNILKDFMQKDTKTLITVMNSIILYKTISKPVAYSLIKRVAEYAKNNKEESENAFQFIYGVINRNALELDNEMLDLLFSLSDDPKFYSFAFAMNRDGFLTCEYVESFIRKNAVKTNDKEFYKFVETFVNKINDKSRLYTSLPFKECDMLWDLCLSDAPLHDSFSYLLVTNYINNDGIILTDSNVIEIFTKDWTSRYTKEKENELFVVLNRFITTFEEYVDTESLGFVSHLNAANRYKIDVEVVGNYMPIEFKTTLYPKTSIFVLMNRVAEYAQIDANRFVLRTTKNAIAPLNFYIDSFVDDNNNAKFTLNMLASREIVSLPHVRKIVPSLIFGNSEISDYVFSAAKRGVKSAKSVTSLLQHNPDSVLKIKELGNMNVTPEELFPIDNLFIFKYNIETVISLLSPEIKKALDEYGFIDYWINILSTDKEFAFFSHIATTIKFIFNKELELKYSQHIFSTVFQAMRNNCLDNEKMLCNYAEFMIKTIVPEGIKEFYSGFQEDVEFFLSDKRENVRNSVLMVLNKLPLPLSMIISLINKRPEAELFTAAIPHVSGEYSSELFDAAFKEVEQNSLCMNQALNLLEELLKTGKVPEEKELELCDVLIDRFLKIDGKNKPKDSFLAAAGCLGKMNNTVLYDYLCKLHKSKDNFLHQEIEGDFEIRTTSSGLVNLGCTCFFNSILQQLFAIPPLRSKIFDYDGDDEFMLKLQLLFAKMMKSNSPAQNTSGVVKYFIGWDGEPMNPLEQQDACEFLQVFLDKLEGTLGVEFIHSLFKGTTVSCIDGIDKEYHSERSEPFYTLQVPVKGYTNLNDSINSLSTPDFLTGTNKYKAEELGLIDAKRTVKVNEMPPYLIIQLTRFEYEYQTMTRTKIDSSLEFPEKLSLNGEYTLTGVIVHIGGADFGHYVSYVKDRLKNIWYLCNDEKVKVVDINDVLSKSFGANSKSGYLLFYDRIDNDYQAQYLVDEEILDKINEGNKLNNEYRVFCSSAYFKLISDFSKSSDPRFVEIALRYYCDSLPNTIFPEKATELGQRIIKMLKENNQLKEVFVSLINMSKISTAILFATCKQVRENTLEMIKTIDPNQVSMQSTYTLFQLTKYATRFYATFNEYFSALNYIISGNEKIKERAIKDDWLLNLSYLLGSEFNEAAREDPDFYFIANLSGMLDLLGNFELSKQLVSYFLDKSVIHCYIYSTTSIESLVRLYKSLPQVYNYKGEFIEKDIKLESLLPRFLINDAEIPRSVEFIIRYFGTEGFDIIDSRIDIPEVAPNYKIVYSFYMALSDPNIRPFFIENVREIIKYLFDEDNVCRLYAARCIYGMNPCKEFEQIEDVYGSSVDIPPVDKEINPKVLQCLEDATKVALNYPNRSEELLKILMYAGSSAGTFLLDKWTFDIFDSRAMILLKAAKEVSCPTKFLIPMEYNYRFAEMLDFFEVLSKHLMKAETTPESTKIFLDDYVFIKLSNCMIDKYQNVVDYLVKCCKEQSEVCKNFIEDKVIEISIVNLSAVCIAAEILHLKLPLAQHISGALREVSFLKPNELVEKVFISDDGTFSDIVPLLNNPTITGNARSLIWQRIKDIPFDKFIDEYGGNDKEECAAFLANHHSNDPFFVSVCKEIATRSCNSFVILSDIVINESLKEDATFVTTVLSFNIRTDEQAEAFIKLIKVTGVTYPVMRKMNSLLRLVQEKAEKGKSDKETVDTLKRYIRVYRETTKNEKVDSKLESLQKLIKEKNIEDFGLF